MVSLKKKMLSATKKLRKIKNWKTRGKNDESKKESETKPEPLEAVMTPHQVRACEALEECRQLGLESNTVKDERSDPDKIETKDDNETAVSNGDENERDAGEANVVKNDEPNVVDDGGQEKNEENDVEDRKEEEIGSEENENATVVANIKDEKVDEKVEEKVDEKVNEKTDAYEADTENKAVSGSESLRTFDTDDCTVASSYPEVEKGKAEYMTDFLAKNKPEPGLFCGCF